MAFFGNPFGPPATPAVPAAPKLPPMQLPPVPAQLPKIGAPTAAQICQASDPSPAAQKLLTPQQTPSQYLNTLQDHQMGDEMVKTLAHGMPDREGVAWAAQSAEKVSGSLPPADVEAMQAAKAWSANPTPETQAAAAAAAAKTDMQGPGALAAQGAAWAKPAASAGAPAGASTSGAMATPRLTPLAVSGSVLLSSAIAANPQVAAPKVPTAAAPTLKIPEVPQMPQAPQLNVPAAPAPVVPPEVQAQTFQAQHPFIASGIDFASGKTKV